MKILEKNGHIIYFDEFKYKEKKELKNYVDKELYLDLLNNFQEKTILVLGGDGSLLSAIRDFSSFNHPFLGINFGTKGFLLNELNHASNNFIQKKFPLLEIELKSKNTKQIFYTFNEIDIRAGNGRIITLEISLNSRNSIFISGDGIIISTPAGSTGYNNSLGGPIIPHDIEAFVLTPKAPFNPKGQAPILFSQDKIINVRNIGRKNTLQIYSDSILMYEGTGESVNLKIKKSKREVTLLLFKDYEKDWNEKILIEQGFVN